jgi:hypothetical protein
MGRLFFLTLPSSSVITRHQSLRLKNKFAHIQNLSNLSVLLN